TSWEPPELPWSSEIVDTSLWARHSWWQGTSAERDLASRSGWSYPVCPRDHRFRRKGMAKKILLGESDIPERWYNILPDLPAPPAPYLHPATLQPMGPADLAPLFPQAIIAQEVSAEPWIEIPDQVREIYRIWRPSPVYRAD